MIFAKLSVHVIDADEAEKKTGASSISEIGPWFLSSPAFEKADVSPISELASSISELASSISKAPLSADFKREARITFQSTLEFSACRSSLLALLRT
ncbi:hypothetical protein FF1_029707 [Malus domestica]